MEVYSCHFMEQNRLNHKQLITCHHHNLPFVAVCFTSTHHVKPHRALSVGMRNLKKKISRKGHFIDDFNKCRYIYVPSWISTEKKKDFWRFLNDLVQQARIPIRATVWPLIRLKISSITRINQRSGSAGWNTFEWGDFYFLLLGTEIGLQSRCLVLVVIRPELLYYFMTL